MRHVFNYDSHHEDVSKFIGCDCTMNRLRGCERCLVQWPEIDVEQRVDALDKRSKSTLYVYWTKRSEQRTLDIASIIRASSPVCI